MGITFAGQSCLAPNRLRQDCLDRGLSIAWWGLPNAFICPLGTEPGEGWLLMARSSLQKIDPALTFAGLYPLVFQTAIVEGPQVPPVTLQNLVILGADAVTPGARGDQAAYLVRVADRRHLAARTTVDSAYNERHVLTEAYLPPTLMGGMTPWTWDGVVGDLWSQCGKLGGYPGLPWTPTQPPEDLEYWQTPALVAIGEVLHRVGCELRYDPLGDVFSIVQVGTPDPLADAALARWDRTRHWDSHAVRSVRGSIPALARVTFRKVPHVRGTDGSPFYTIDQADLSGNGGGGEAGTVALVPDDLEARYDATGALTNLASLTLRATERAADFFRRLWSVTDRRRRLYPFALGDKGLLPGSQIQSIRWADAGDETLPGRGMSTEVVRVGEVPRPGWPDVQIDPLTEVVRLTGGVSADGLLDAYRQMWDAPSQGWVDRQQIWVKDANA